MRRRAPAAFSLIELLVVIGIITLLLAFILPALEGAREQTNTVRCANNLRQIGMALELYADANHGNDPRTRYVPGAPLTAGTEPVQANDTTGPLFLLMRVEKLPPQIFADPYNDEIQYTPDGNFPSHSNFSDYRKNLAYSYANPYPDQHVADAGYQLTSHIPAGFVIAADLNPGTGPGMNSRNHEGKGQNVLFGDGRVEWWTGTKCGMFQDEIYVNRAGLVWGSPANSFDDVLLPAEK